MDRSSNRPESAERAGHAALAAATPDASAARTPDASAAGTAAAAVLESVPPIMRAIRAQMRAGRPTGVSVAQFRALLYIRRTSGTGLSGVADHLGTSLPAASELVSRLVAAGLVDRAPNPASGRRICLTLSAPGAAHLASAQDRTVEWLAGCLASLPPDRLDAVTAVLAEVRALLDADRG